MHFVFVTAAYPSPAFPHSGIFVHRLITAISRMGHPCSVISPVRWLARRFGPLPPRETHDEGEGAGLSVYRPRVLSFSMRQFGPFRAALLTQAAFNRATLRTVRRLKQAASVFYGHFLYLGGRAAVVAGKAARKPSVIAVGEGTFWTVEPIGFERAKVQLRDAGGFIAVSTFLKEALQRSLDIPEKKIGVFPNGVDLSLFYPRDREAMRRKYGFSEGPLKIAFVGTFDEPKGVARLVEAVEPIDGVELILVGRGSVRPPSNKVVFRGTAEHWQVPELLSAADLFVLPSRIEGSCNAVIEAMACGLPIITSSGGYMDDLVDDQTAVRVDPMDVRAIRSAVQELAQDPARRARMGAAALIKARSFDIENRARRIVKWIQHLGQETFVRPEDLGN